MSQDWFLNNQFCFKINPGPIIIKYLYYQAHSDLSLLRDLLLDKHTKDMMDVTTKQHYEKFRCDKIAMQWVEYTIII